MKGRWVLLGVAGAGAALAAGLTWSKNARATAEALPATGRVFSVNAIKSISEQINTKFPGATITTRPVGDGGYMRFDIVTVQGIKHMAIYRDDGDTVRLYSQS